VLRTTAGAALVLGGLLILLAGVFLRRWNADQD
jgi:LPXTG-motif cell wall-anchored protein